MSPILLTLALFCILVGGWLYLRSGQLRRSSGLPAGEISYVDAGDWRRNHRPLFSEHYQLTGKPDYLVERGGVTIPVEVKSGHLRGDDPYDSHKLQLAAYCLLVEDSTGVRPPHGILKYANTTLQLPYTDALRAELLATLDHMRAARTAHNLARNHDDPARCRNCGYQHACGAEALSFK